MYGQWKSNVEGGDSMQACFVATFEDFLMIIIYKEDSNFTHTMDQWSAIFPIEEMIWLINDLSSLFQRRQRKWTARMNN